MCAYVRTFRHTSEVLRGNFLGDPHVRDLPVYLPPNYSDRRREPYPVVFMLAGWGGRGANYLADGGVFSPTLSSELDKLIESGRLQPVIVVFPDCSTRLGSSQYINSTVNGDYMDYLCDELVDWVDRRFHTHGSRDYRGVIGHSSGGFGALVCAMMRSDRFGAMCSSSGDCWFAYLYQHSIPQTISAITEAAGIEPFVERFLSCPNPTASLGLNATVAMLNLSMCSCYSPNPHVPAIFGDLWFDLETGQTVEEVWKLFLDWDPVNLIDRHVTALKSLRWIHLEAGSHDEYGLHLGHRQLSAKLTALGIEHVHEEYPGRHGGHHHRMPSRIARMVDRLL